MLELINVEDLYENDEIIIMDSIFFNNNKLIENIEIGFKNKNGDIIGIKGRIESRILEKENNKSILQVIAEKVTFLSSKPTQE